MNKGLNFAALPGNDEVLVGVKYSQLIGLKNNVQSINQSINKSINLLKTPRYILFLMTEIRITVVIVFEINPSIYKITVVMRIIL